MDLTLYDAAKKFKACNLWQNEIAALGMLYNEDKSVYADIIDFRRRAKEVLNDDPGMFMDLLKQSYRITARDVFDDYCVYLEWNRRPGSRFYLPRRKGLLPVVENLQALADGELDILCISLPPGTGKTELAIFFMTWLAGRDPKDGMLGGSHNAAFLRGVYDECLRIMDKEGEYLWADVFSEHSVVRTNALDMKIDIDKPQRFSTFQFTSIGAGNAGKVRAIQLLYCDDLIESIEEAMSKERLDKKWQAYTVDLRQRKQGNKARELHIATRWSVNDIIGRLERQYEDDPRARFVSVPALTEEGESNFDYGGTAGFTKEFFEDIKASMDDASWRALYMNEPIEREGLLYERDALRRYYALPDREPDAVLAVCDTATGAGDDTVLPVFAVYGSDHYLIDCVCYSGLPEVSDEMCANALVRNNVVSCQFESNAAGGRTADKVEELVRKKGGKTHITKKWTQANKQTKIIVNSAWIKAHCLFLSDNKLKKGCEYDRLLNKLCSYTMSGKNKHDDVPDAMAQYALYTDNMIGNIAVVGKRPF